MSEIDLFELLVLSLTIGTFFLSYFASLLCLIPYNWVFDASYLLGVLFSSHLILKVSVYLLQDLSFSKGDYRAKLFKGSEADFFIGRFDSSS